MLAKTGSTILSIAFLAFAFLFHWNVQGDLFWKFFASPMDRLACYSSNDISFFLIVLVLYIVGMITINIRSTNNVFKDREIARKG